MTRREETAVRTVRILVTGSRLWADVEKLQRVLDETAAGYATVTIRHGQCDPRNTKGQVVKWGYAAARPDLGPFLGADWLADRYALQRGWTTERFAADWNTYGNAAGSIRNQRMLDTSPRPTLVIGFPLGDSPGTRDCMRRARAARVRTIDATAAPEPAGLW